MSSQLYLNNQLVEPCIIRNEIIEDKDALTIDLPNHILVDKKNSDILRADLDENDIDVLSQLFRIDTDKYLGKKVRVIISIVGNTKR